MQWLTALVPQIHRFQESLPAHLDLFIRSGATKHLEPRRSNTVKRQQDIFIHCQFCEKPGHLKRSRQPNMGPLIRWHGSDRVVFGPVVGAAVVLFLQYTASIHAPARWPFILGGVFVLSVMFLRQGISVHLLRLWDRVVYGYGSASG